MDRPSQCTLEFLDIDKITLDIGNPRIAKWIEMYGENPSVDQIDLALGAESTTSEDGGPSRVTLRESIRTNGGVIHPIIVNKTDSDVVVIEGNTRLQIYRELSATCGNGQWSRIPCLVYENLNQADVDAIRLQAHLVGVRKWDPFSKAKYLNHLRNQHHLTLEQVVAYCGGNKTEVLTYINAYNDMNRYYMQVLESDGEFDPTRFSAFAELQSSRVIKGLADHGYTKLDFARWVYDGRLHPLNLVRRLPQILDDSRSRQIFLSSGAQEAIKVLDILPQHVSVGDLSMTELAREACRRINAVKYEELQQMKKHSDSEEVEALMDLKDTLLSLHRDIFGQED